LEDRLVTLLGRDQPEGMRVIVVLDALDEAAEPIEPWSKNIGRGVYLLVTCRAEEEETPAVLRMWRRRFEKDGTLALEYPLSALDTAAIAAWLTAAEHREIKATDPLVIRVLEASEGVALFAVFLIPHAIEQLRTGAVDPLPRNFTDYAFEQLDDLRTGRASFIRRKADASDPRRSFAIWTKISVGCKPRRAAFATPRSMDPQSPTKTDAIRPSFACWYRHSGGRGSPFPRLS
jgi:hypothetical protein